MPKSVLPKDFKLGPDNQSWLMRLKKRVQVWFAASPRVPSGFWKWRELPTLLFFRCGEGHPRWENTDGTVAYKYGPLFWGVPMYLSRIQPWLRWHISLQWPLFFSCHFIYKTKNVIPCPNYRSDFGITEMVTFHIGYKRDSDRIYWPAIFFGGNFE